MNTQQHPGLLRHWRQEDLPEIIDMEKSLFPVDAWPAEAFEAEMFQPETREYFVFEHEGKILAYAGIMCVPPIADVQTIAVRAEYEGQAIGRRLLARLIHAARDRGAEDLLLEVREDNQRARRLYELHGFEQIHVRKNYYRDGTHALIMRLFLAEEKTRKATEEESRA